MAPKKTEAVEEVKEVLVKVKHPTTGEVVEVRPAAADMMIRKQGYIDVAAAEIADALKAQAAKNEEK